MTTPPNTFPTVKLTDTAMAEQFVARVGRQWTRWDPINRYWRHYDGVTWAVDHRGKVVEAMKQVVSDMVTEALTSGDADVAKAILAYHSEPRINATLELARTIPGISTLPTEFDADPWLLNTAKHVLDLRTGQARDHDPDDLLTKLCPVVYDPDAQCPMWLRFLERIFAGDAELIAVVQRVLGAALAGIIRENVFIILWGTGANGKSVLMRVMLHLFGSYGLTLRADVFIDRKNDPQGFALADLPGVRLAVAFETQSGSRLDEALVKAMTGRDKIPAARKYGQPFVFEPVFKPVLVTNHKPVIEGQDHAIWRRVKLIPFNVTIPEPEQDPALSDTLIAEAPGVLNWLLAGCYAWQRQGMAFPKAVKEATEEYRAAEDVLGPWKAARCVVQDGLRDDSSKLYADYVTWAQEEKQQPITQTRFGRLLSANFPIRRAPGSGKHMRTGIARKGVAREGFQDVKGFEGLTQESPSRARVGEFSENGSQTLHNPSQNGHGQDVVYDDSGHLVDASTGQAVDEATWLRGGPR
jgi:putative DNA primase/helicase